MRPDQIERQRRVMDGQAVVTSMRKGADKALISWAADAGLLVRIDRKTDWGNPFVIGQHGSRDEVIARYAAYLRAAPALIERLPDLAGKVLACWCYPDRCHGDVICEEISRQAEPKRSTPCAAAT